MSSSEKKSNRKHEKSDDSVLSHNHSKSVRFRLRAQQEREAVAEIKEYKDTEEYKQYYDKDNNAGL
jgi:hypothetical protein